MCKVKKTRKKKQHQKKKARKEGIENHNASPKIQGGTKIGETQQKGEVKIGTIRGRSGKGRPAHNQTSVDRTP